MSNYRDMRTRIANELARDDISTEIANFIQDAIKHYQIDAFARGYKELAALGTIVAGTQTFALPTDFLKWVQLRWAEPAPSPSTYYQLKEVDLASIWNLQPQIPLTQSTPQFYAVDYANRTCVFWPVPSQPGTLTGRYQYMIPAPTSDVNPADGAVGTPAEFWMNQAEAMVRAYAKFLLNTQMLRDDEAAKTNAVTANEEYRAIRTAYESQVYTTGIKSYGGFGTSDDAGNGEWWYGPAWGA